MICALAALCLIGATAVDGDTIRSDGQRLRIWGIQAPEMGEPGGDAAKSAMRRLIAGRALSCDVIDIDRYDRPVVRCDLPDGTDLACRLVAMGAAVDWPKYSRGAYEGCER
jgi:endonuclease YncB( thermonuclease family)